MPLNKVLLLALAIIQFALFMQMKFWLHDVIEKGAFRSIWIYPIKLKESIADPARLRRIRLVRALWLASFLGLIAVFVPSMERS